MPQYISINKNSKRPRIFGFSEVPSRSAPSDFRIFGGSEPLRACSRPPVRAQSRSEPARGRLCALRACSRPPVRSKSMLQCALAWLRLCVRICSSKKLFDKAVSGGTETLFSYTLHSSTLFSFSSVHVYARVRTSIILYREIHVYLFTSFLMCFRSFCLSF